MILFWLMTAFAELSVLAVGGANAVLPEMRALVVTRFHWVSDPEFSHMFALAQAAPGPNIMVVPLVGWQVAGFGGLVAVMVGMFVPSSVLAYTVAGQWDRFAARPWRVRLQAAIVPVSAGLVASGAAVIIQATDTALPTAIIAAVVAGLSLVKRIHPVALLAASAAAGVALAASGTLR